MVLTCAIPLRQINHTAYFHFIFHYTTSSHDVHQVTYCLMSVTDKSAPHSLQQLIHCVGFCEMVHSANYFHLLQWTRFWIWKKNYTLQRKLYFIIYFLIKIFCIKAAKFNVSCAPHIYHIYLYHFTKDNYLSHTQLT